MSRNVIDICRKYLYNGRAKEVRYAKAKEMQARMRASADARSKGETVMRIAVAYENGSVFQHFGHHDHEHGGDPHACGDHGCG
jgi:hypothetical protein